MLKLTVFARKGSTDRLVGKDYNANRQLVSILNLKRILTLAF